MYLFSKPCILKPQVMFIKWHFSYCGWSTTIRTRSIAKSFPIPHVISSKLLVLGSKLCILMPLVLCLQKQNTPFNAQLTKKLRQNLTHAPQSYRYTFIWVRLFWNQNLTCNGSNPNSLLSSFLCLSSGCGHSLKNLHKHNLISSFKKYGRCFCIKLIKSLGVQGWNI